MPSKAQRLRAAVEDSGRPPVVLVGAHNAVAARLAELYDFDGCWLSSFEVTATLGLSDRNVIGRAEMVHAARYVALATNLPLVVDADNGYGSAPAMIRAARELAAIDVAGMCVEDARFPKRNSFDPAGDGCRPLEDAGEFAGRIAATRKALGSAPFVLIARTEALVAELGTAEALARAELYARSGADLVVVHSRDVTGEEAVTVAREWSPAVPLVTIPTAFPQLSPARLGALGYRVVIYANQLLRSSVAGMELTLSALRAGTALELEPDLAPMARVFELTDSEGLPA